jgi:hypothetical protein
MNTNIQEPQGIGRKEAEEFIQHLDSQSERVEERRALLDDRIKAMQEIVSGINTLIRGVADYIQCAVDEAQAEIDGLDEQLEVNEKNKEQLRALAGGATTPAGTTKLTQGKAN